VSQEQETKPFDPYDVVPSFWERHTTMLVAAAVFVVTALLTVLSFPPYKTPEFAYAFASPALLWAYRRPSFKLFAGVVLGANMLAWIIVLSWVHYVSWLGMVLIGCLVGVWVGVWFLAAWWLLPRMPSRGMIERILGVFGLAALWVLIEWSRTWLLSGFPWLTLGTSQWQRVSVLQIASYTGASGVSFVLIAMNVSFAAYAHRLFFEHKVGLQRRSQEFFACLFLLVVCVTLHVRECFNRGAYTVDLGRVTLVQPYIPQKIKWEASEAPGILAVLERSVLTAGRGKPDLILLPEATTPMAVRGEEDSRQWVEKLTQKAGAPLIFGSLAIENKDKPNELWYNAVFVSKPDTGIDPAYYAKRHLVPFGEYVPLRFALGWLSKVVPVGDDFESGKEARSLVLNIRGHIVPFGPLICYEDIFPSLARSSVRSGAEVLLVLTNDAWYGESAAAEQHAAHSVMRAVETRRPVLRCGNTGWSGWIDEFGSVRTVLTNKDGKIFIRANVSMEVTRDFRWIGRQSFYVMHGDWFVAVCAGLSLLAFALFHFRRNT
jgi:apolipoprotein N-acyltransferase